MYLFVCLFVCLFGCIVPLELSRMLAKKFNGQNGYRKIKYKEYKNVNIFLNT